MSATQEAEQHEQTPGLLVEDYRREAGALATIPQCERELGRLNAERARTLKRLGELDRVEGDAGERQDLRLRLELIELATPFVRRRVSELHALAELPAIRTLWAQWLTLYGTLVQVSMELEQAHKAAQNVPVPIALAPYMPSHAAQVVEALGLAMDVADPTLQNLLGRCGTVANATGAV